MPILKYDSELWKMDGFIELGVLANLLIASVLLYYGESKIAVIFDSIFAIIISIIALRVPLKGSQEALNQILDKTLPDEIQFDIIAVVAENLNDMCEFKQVHTRQSGKDIFIELDIVLPFDSTIETKFGFEKQLQDKIKEKYPTAISRVYAVACDKDCIFGGTRRCPVFLKKQEAEENNE
jgi:divalent metal cation (Fe/Co/Zn/Cd) transporter